MRINDVRIGTRLAIGFSVLLLVSTALSAIGIWHLNLIEEKNREMMEKPLEKERLASDWHRLISVSVRRSIAVAKSSDTSLAGAFAADVREATEESRVVRSKLESLFVTDEERSLFKKINELGKAGVAARDEIFKARNEGNAEKANHILDADFIRLATDQMKGVRELLDLQRKTLDDLAVGINETSKSSRKILVLLNVIALVLGATWACFLTASITRPLSAAVRFVDKVASGDLTSKIEPLGRDETGQLLLGLKTMNEKLHEIVAGVHRGTDAIANASTEIAAGNLDLSSRTEEQAASLEETASSMEQLTAAVSQNAENARQARTLANNASEVTAKGGEVVANVERTMAKISESSRRINEITAMIEGIAFQTNILALNAAVEAARAGEQGRGFAVVASEVRSLAQRSSSAAREIKALIEESAQGVLIGSELVSEAGRTMEEVIHAIRRVTDLVGEISAASQEQSSGIEQVNHAVMQMDEMTQQNAALVEQAAAAAQSLEEQSKGLKEAVSAFRIGSGISPVCANQQQLVVIG